MIKIIIPYFAAISTLSVLITIADKKAAKSGKSRVPENTLILFSMLGGSFFMFLTMCLICHKTRKPKFMVGLPLIMLAQVALAVFCVKFAVFG